MLFVEMLTTATWRREVFVLFGAVLLRAVCAAVLRCSFPLGELEPLHQVGRSGSRFIMCGAVRLRAVQIVSHKLFVHSERIRSVTLGVCTYIFVLHSCAILSLLKYIIDENELFAEQQNVYIVESHIPYI